MAECARWPSYRCIWRALICPRVPAILASVAGAAARAERARPSSQALRRLALRLQSGAWMAQDESEFAHGWKWYAWNQPRKCGGATGETAAAVSSSPGGARRRLRQRGLRRWRVGSAAAYFKPALALHRPLCETVGYARRAAANSRPLAHRRKEKWNAAQWCGRARRLYTPVDLV